MDIYVSAKHIGDLCRDIGLGSNFPSVDLNVSYVAYRRKGRNLDGFTIRLTDHQVAILRHQVSDLDIRTRYDG